MITEFLENTKEFEVWLYHMLRDAKEKLDISDDIVAYVLLREGLNYYLKTIASKKVKNG